MSEWSSKSYDRIVKLSGSWFRASAVDVVLPLGAGSKIVTRSGEFVIEESPDDVSNALWKEPSQ